MNPAAAIVAYLRANMEGRAEQVRVGPFLACFDRESDNRYRNYALPDEAAQPTDTQVRALVAAFRTRGRLPRLEYVTDLAPGVWPVLAGNGFSEEGVLELMTLGERGLIAPSVSDSFTAAIVTADADLEAAARVQNEAYVEPQTSMADIERLRSLIARGGAVALARSSLNFEALGAGLYSAPWKDLTELAAIGVRAADRGRGIGSQLTAVLTQHALGSGIARPFLMAAHEAEARIYRRVGYVPSARMLHVLLDAQQPSRQLRSSL